MVHIYAPKYNPEKSATFHYAISIPASQLSLYLFMGRELQLLDSVCSLSLFATPPCSIISRFSAQVPSGCVFGIGGVGHHLLKSGTMSTLNPCPTFKQMTFQARLLFVFSSLALWCLKSVSLLERSHR
jgi:hypothetical protein